MSAGRLARDGTSAGFEGEKLGHSDSAHPWASPLRGAVNGVQNGCPAILSGIKIKKGYPAWGSPFLFSGLSTDHSVIHQSRPLPNTPYPVAENSEERQSGHHRSDGRRPQHIACRSADGNSACRLQTVRPLFQATNDMLGVVLLSAIGSMMPFLCALLSVDT